MFDEQPDGDTHGECAAEIQRLRAELATCKADRHQDFENFRQQMRVYRSGPKIVAITTEAKETTMRAMTEDQLIALAVKHKLGRTMKPLGMQTGDVFVTDRSYRTGELLAFARAIEAAERERCAKLCEQMNEGQVATHYDWTKQVGAVLAAAIRDA